MKMIYIRFFLKKHSISFLRLESISDSVKDNTTVTIKSHVAGLITSLSKSYNLS